MATSGEPPTKKQSIDFTRCLKCQREKWIADSATIKGRKQEALACPNRESYEKFIDVIELRAGYGNQDFALLNQRMRGLSADILEENHAVWHRTCYGEVTHKGHTDRDQKRFEKALSEKNSEMLSYKKTGGRPKSSNTTHIADDVEDSETRHKALTRSHVSSFKRELCFYCQDIKHDHKHARAGSIPEQVHVCRSADIGASIEQIVNASDNDVWKLNMADILAEGDFHARDITYHTSCHTKQWQHYMQQPQTPNTRRNSSDEDSIAFISAEIEFAAELQERLDNGELITLTEVTALYTNMMCDHGILDKQISRQHLLAKLEQKIANFTITGAKGRKPAVLHSKETGRSAIDQTIEDRDIKGDMTTLYWCSKIIRQSILKTRKESPWSFEGTLVGCSEAGIPTELITFMRWILQGAKAATTETRTELLHNSCLILSQSVVQACKTNRQITLAPVSSDSKFRNMFENPYAVGLSLYMYHNFRSQKAVSLLNRCGAGISFDRVTTICNNIAHAVARNITEYGVYVPPGLLRNKSMRASLDNVDKKVDTPDGKGSFHGTALAVYQRSGQGETVAKPVQVNSKSLTSEALHDVPPTVINMVPCTIEGSPKPRTSPHYANYKMGVYDDNYRISQINDIGWMVARFCNRPSIQRFDSEASAVDNDVPGGSTIDKMNTQHVPVWSAYNSLTHEPLPTDAPTVIDQAYGLPIINAPAHEWSTLVTALDQLSRVNEHVSGPGSKLVVTMDMDLYKRALKLAYLDPQYKDRWVLCPGAFHTVLSALRCLGRTIEGSGLDDAWQEADMYSSITVTQIINGNHHNRALQAHQITLQALFDLWLTAFLDNHPQVCDSLHTVALELTEACRVNQDVHTTHQAFAMKLESMNLEKQLLDYDQANEKNPMYKWARMYMRQVMVLLQFQRATREGNWFLYLSTLEKLCVYFFAYNRLDYAQNIPEYTARMHGMQTTDPVIWQEFVNGDFTVNTSNTIPFTRIAVDQAMEHMNKSTKGQGGISGITSNPKTLLKFCLTGPELARITAEGERLTTITNSDTNHQKHHCLSQAKVHKQEHSITQLKKVLVPCRLFSGSSQLESDAVEDVTTGHMYKLLSNEILPDHIKENILSTEKIGMAAYTRFVQDRLTGVGNLWAKMTKVKLLSWTASAKEIKLKAGSEVLTLKASSSLFARMLIIARSSRDDIDLAEVIGTHEFAHTNRALMQPDGSVHPTTDKSAVIHLLEKLLQPGDPTIQTATIQSTTEEEGVCLIVDGMAVLQELMAVKNVKTCKELGTSYVQLIDSKGRGYDQVRVIFDNYTKVSSLKEGTRERRRGKSKGIRSYVVKDSTSIRDKSLFLSSNETKDSLTMYLAQQLVNQSSIGKLVTATRSSVMKSSEVHVSTGVSTQEEADTIMVLHAVEVAGSGLDVHIYSQDTDVLLLALRRVPLLGTKPAMIMGTSEHRRKVMLKPIYDVLGSDKASALINWHALTGCDTTGHIQGTSKKGCFATFLNSSPAVIDALIKLGEGAEPSDAVVKGCEEFLCSLVCPKQLHITLPKDLRWHMFKRLRPDQGVDKLPPTEGAWIEHIRRAHMQASIWSQDQVVNPVNLDPVMLGWQLVDSKMVPVLSKVAAAPESILQLIRCNCGSTNVNSTNKCSRRCSCKQNNIVCTELCHCTGDYKCKNTEPILIGEDIDDDGWNLLDTMVH